jgi:hypothetical protein
MIVGCGLVFIGGETVGSKTTWALRPRRKAQEASGLPSSPAFFQFDHFEK